MFCLPLFFSLIIIYSCGGSETQLRPIRLMKSCYDFDYTKNIFADP